MLSMVDKNVCVVTTLLILLALVAMSRRSSRAEYFQVSVEPPKKKLEVQKIELQVGDEPAGAAPAAPASAAQAARNAVSPQPVSTGGASNAGRAAATTTAATGAAPSMTALPGGAGTGILSSTGSTVSVPNGPKPVRINNVVEPPVAQGGGANVRTAAAAQQALIRGQMPQKPGQGPVKPGLTNQAGSLNRNVAVSGAPMTDKERMELRNLMKNERKRTVMRRKNRMNRNKRRAAMRRRRRMMRRKNRGNRTPAQRRARRSKRTVNRRRVFDIADRSRRGPIRGKTLYVSRTFCRRNKLKKGDRIRVGKFVGTIARVIRNRKFKDKKTGKTNRACRINVTAEIAGRVMYGQQIKLLRPKGAAPRRHRSAAIKALKEKYTIQRGRMIQGKTMRRVPAGNGRCLKACSVSAECKGFSVNRAQKACYLKSSITKTVPRKGRVAVIKK